MSKHFETELNNLKNTIIKMASSVDEMVEKSYRSLKDLNPEIGRTLYNEDREVDAYDNLLQAECENILAIFQPVAVDLRIVLTALLLTKELERCGDIAVNIYQRVKKFSNNKELVLESKILEMGTNARVMVKEAIDSYINNDIQLAEKVLASDDDVDKYNKSIFKFVVEKLRTNPGVAEDAANLLICSRHIERLGDHATNIAEHVIFLIDAQIVAHKSKLKET